MAWSATIIVLCGVIVKSMTDSPMILIPVSVQDAEKRRFGVSQQYVRSVIDAGGLPVLLPVTVDEPRLRRAYDLCAGVMLTGGADCDPAAYGEAAHPRTYGIDADRDRAELLLTRWAVSDDRPLFGICRGVQMMNVAMGGTLIQDIPSQWSTSIEHSAPGERNAESHRIRAAAGSRLAAALDAGDVGVNSFHHQSIGRLGEGFVVSAEAADGVVEGIEMPARRFAVGVQWHPEDLSAERREMQALFNAFVRACRLA